MPSAAADLQLLPRHRKTGDEDLIPAGFVRLIGDPSRIWFRREAARQFIERTMQVRLRLLTLDRLSARRDRKHPQVLIGLCVAFAEQNESSIARPIRGISQPAGLCD